MPIVDRPVVAVLDLRLVPHPPVCPDCGSDDVGTEQVDMGDGTSETAYLCKPCGAAWPLACVCEWSTRHARR
jgi:transposase-like protein